MASTAHIMYAPRVVSVAIDSCNTHPFTQLQTPRIVSQDGDGDKTFNVTRAAAEAAAADYCVVIVYCVTGEGMDRPNISLDAWQDLMVQTVVAANKNTIVVARVSGAFAMPWLDSVPAVLYQLMPGTAAGHAAGEVIVGDRNPSGKLTITFPTSMNTTWLGSPVVNPVQYNCSAFAEVEYTEELEVGYRYYAAHPDAPPPLYPFGHGVGFSKFVYGGLKASSTEVTLTVQNTGLVSGVEIAQLYLGFPVASGEPPKVLAGFSRALVAKGATETLQIPLTDRSLSTWSVTANAWVKITGDFAVHVGASSADIRLTGKFTVG